MMSKKLFYCIFTILVIWNLWSLVYSPTAWFDEVYFASATHSFISGNGLAVELDHYQPCVAYGPVFFMITGAVTKVFGFGMFQFRIINCLFAFISVFLLGSILKKLNIKATLIYLIQLIFLTDVLFITNSHSGRMEFVALLFVLVAYMYFLNQDKNELVKTLFVSLMLTLAFMTTPRVFVICVPIAVYQFYNLIKSRSWLLLTIYVTIPVVLYGLWVYIAFGSIGEMINYYTQVKPGGGGQRSLLGTFVKGNWAISKFHYPMILAALASVVILMKERNYKNLILYFLPILVYYFLVTDTGMYGALILPFYMILIAIGAAKLFGDDRRFLRVPYIVLVTICLLINCSIFSFKAFAVVSTKEFRDPRQPVEWIARNIPKGSRVAGDYDYYYASIDNGCRFRRISNEFVKDENNLKDIIDTFNPDYIVLRKSHLKISELPLFISSGYEKISELDYENDSMLFPTLQKMTNISFTSSYAGCIYKRVKTKRERL